jgi:membrane protein implicated in regulation of membrane protease activity
MSRTKGILVLVFLAAVTAGAVSALNAGALFVISARGAERDQLDLLRPKVLFASFAVVLVATCLLLQLLVRARRRREKETNLPYRRE